MSPAVFDLTRDIAKNQLLAVRPVRRWAEGRRRRGALVDHESSRPEYAKRTYEHLSGEMSPFRPLSGRLLEIGPGGNLGTAALFVKNGMDAAVCIDVVAWEAADRSFYEALGVCDSLAQVEYLWPVPIEDTRLEGGTFDVIVSYACFEHFIDPAAACVEIARLLKPGGITGHLVDLRDHRDFDRPLDFLRYRDWLWNLVCSRRPFRTNRWRASELIEAFQQAGLEIVLAKATLTADVSDSERVEFQPRFRRKSLEDLATTGVFVVAVKPH